MEIFNIYGSLILTIELDLINLKGIAISSNNNLLIIIVKNYLNI